MAVIAGLMASFGGLCSLVVSDILLVRALLLPQTVGLGGGFPQFDCAVFAACSVEFAIRGECAGPYGTVVTLACFCSCCQLLSIHDRLRGIAYQSQRQSRDPTPVRRYL